MIENVCVPWEGDCRWSARYLWASTHWLVHLDIIFLLAMLAYAIAISIRSSYRIHLCRDACRAVLSQLAEARASDYLPHANALSAEPPRNPASRVLTAGLTAFAVVSPSRKLGLQSAMAAMHRSRRAIISSFEHEANNLGEITCLAPWLALAGTCIGIVGAFRGVGMEHHAAVAMTMYYTVISLFTTATGLLIVIPVSCLHYYLRTRLDKCGVDLKEVVRATLALLGAFSNRLPSGAPLSDTSSDFFIGRSSVGEKFSLRPRLSFAPSFALIASTFLVLIVLGFTVVRSGEPVGVDVRVLRTNESVRGDNLGAEGTFVEVLNSSVHTSPVVYVDSNKLTLSDLNGFMQARAKLRPNGTVYVHAADDVPWEAVATAIDASEAKGGGVVLLTSRLGFHSSHRFPPNVR